MGYKNTTTLLPLRNNILTFTAINTLAVKIRILKTPTKLLLFFKKNVVILTLNVMMLYISFKV